MGQILSTYFSKKRTYIILFAIGYYYYYNEQQKKRLAAEAAEAEAARKKKEEEEQQELQESNKHVVKGRYGTYSSTGDIEKDFKQAKKKKQLTTWEHLQQVAFMCLPTMNDTRGLGWILGLVGLVATDTWLNGVYARLLSRIMSSIHLRKNAQFWSLLQQHALLGILYTIIQATKKMVQARISLSWRSKLTSILHDSYFKNMNYYFLVHSKKSKLQDPDQRIANDVTTITDGMASLLNDFVVVAATTIYFGAELMQQLGLVYALAPYLWLFFGKWWTDKWFSLDWRRLVGTMEYVFSAYRGGHMRLSLNSEAISALKGEDVERGILEVQLEKTEGVQRRFWEALVPYQFCGTIAFYDGMKWFNASAVIGPLLFSGVTMNRQRADIMSEFSYRMNVFGHSARSAGLLIFGWRNLARLSGNASRVTKLFNTLEDMGNLQIEKRKKNFKDGDYIEFENVDIYTPTGVKLVEDLSFRLGVGESLMITGHNGAGKSSIFRCLGGLWDIPKGKITKPGGYRDGLHKDIFYLPQKPYNVLGTLMDQLTYPYTSSNNSKEDLTKEELRQLLNRVDLAYLADREGVLTDEVNWEEVLSLGEKQRLAMARLIYHHPKFAILDECTSAVSTEMELRLFHICHDLNITYITISHRPALQQFHDRILSIGDGKCGYKITKVPAHLRTPSGSTSSFGEKWGVDTEASIKKFSDARSKKYQKLVSQRDDDASRKVSTVTKALALLKIGIPPGSGIGGKILFALFSITGRSFMGLVWPWVRGNMVGTLLQNDRAGFLRYVAYGFFWILGSSAFDRCCEWSQRNLGTDIRMAVSRSLLKSYFDSKGYYRLKNLDGSIKDPESRLSDEIRSFALVASELVSDFAKPLVDIVIFVIVLRNYISARLLGGTLAYTIVGIGLLKWIMPDYRELVRRDQKLNGKFKFEHSRVRSCSESIAFFGGDAREKAVLNNRYKQVEKLKIDTLWKEWAFGLLNQYFIEDVPDNINLVAQFAALEEVSTAASGANALNAVGNQQLIDLGIERMFESFSKLLEFGPKVAKISGFVHRIYDIHFEMEALKNGEQYAKMEKLGLPIVRAEVNANEIEFANIDIVTPKGLCLAQDLNVRVTKGNALMVTGPNACGKSSLSRVLGDLWPTFPGSKANGSSLLAKPSGPDPTKKFMGVFLVPQRMYMADGTLADQVTYPLRIKKEDRTKEDEAKMFEQLKLVGIEYLVARNEKDGGWDAKNNWENVFSLGEQQRMGMARLFYHSPMYAVLDECTSAVSIDVERRMYEAAYKKGITCVTISQRLALEEFHSKELKLGVNNEKGWDTEKIATVEKI